MKFIKKIINYNEELAENCLGKKVPHRSKYTLDSKNGCLKLIFIDLQLTIIYTYIHYCLIEKTLCKELRDFKIEMISA